MSENLPPNSSQSTATPALLSPRTLLSNILSTRNPNSPKPSVNIRTLSSPKMRGGGGIRLEVQQPTSDPEENGMGGGGMPTPPTSQSPPKRVEGEEQQQYGEVSTVKKPRRSSPRVSSLLGPSSSQTTPTNAYTSSSKPLNSSQSTARRSRSRSSSALPLHLQPSSSKSDHLPLHSPQALRVARARSRSTTPQPLPAPASPWLSQTSTTKAKGKGRKSTPIKKVPSETLDTAVGPRASEEEESEDPLLLKGGEESRGWNEGNPRYWGGSSSRSRSRSRSVSQFSTITGKKKQKQKQPVLGTGLGLGIAGAGVSPGAKFDEQNRDWSPLREPDSDSDGQGEDMGGFDWQPNGDADDTFAFKNLGEELRVQVPASSQEQVQQPTPPSTQPLQQSQAQLPPSPPIVELNISPPQAPTLSEILARHRSQAPSASESVRSGGRVKDEEVEESLSDSAPPPVEQVEEVDSRTTEPLGEVATDHGIDDEEEEKEEDEEEEDIPILSSLQANRITPLKSRRSLITIPSPASRHTGSNTSSPYRRDSYHDFMVPLAPISSSPSAPAPSSHRRSSTALHTSSPRQPWQATVMRRSVSTFGDDDDIDAPFRDKSGDVMGEGSEGVGQYDFGSLGETTDESEGDVADGEENGEDGVEEGEEESPESPLLLQEVKEETLDRALSPAHIDPEPVLEQLNDAPPPKELAAPSDVDTCPSEADAMQVSPARPRLPEVFESPQRPEDVHMASPSPARSSHVVAPASPTPLRSHPIPASLQKLRSIKRVEEGREKLEQFFCGASSAQRAAGSAGRTLVRDLAPEKEERAEVRMVEREHGRKVLPELIHFGKRSMERYEEPHAPPIASTSTAVLPPATTVNNHTPRADPPQPTNSTTSSLSRRRASHPSLPVVEISSTDPEAAARAAAILKVHHSYVENGIVSELSSDGESADEEEEGILKEMLGDAEAKLARLAKRSGRVPSVAVRSPSPQLEALTQTSAMLANITSSDKDATPVPSNTSLAWTSNDWRRLEQSLVDEIRRLRKEGKAETVVVEDVVESFMESEGLTEDDLKADWAWSKLELRVRALQERRAKDRARKLQEAASSKKVPSPPTTLDVELSRASNSSPYMRSSSPLQEDEELTLSQPHFSEQSSQASTSDEEREEEDDTFFERARPHSKPAPLPIKQEDDDDDYIVPPLALATTRFAHLYDEPIARPPLPSQMWVLSDDIDDEEESYEEEEEEEEEQSFTPEGSREPSMVPSSARKLMSYFGSFVRAISPSADTQRAPSQPEMQQVPSFASTSQPFPVLPSVSQLRKDRLIRPLPTPSTSGSTPSSSQPERRRRSSGEGKVWDQISALEDAESSREEERATIEMLQSAGVKRKAAEQLSMEELRRKAGPSSIPRIVYGALMSPAMVPTGTRATDKPIGSRTFFGRKR